MTTEIKRQPVGLQVVRDGDGLARWRQSLSISGADGERLSISSANTAETRTLSEKPLIGLVTTMGALHQGHLKLVEMARRQCQHVVVSIFVNPLQFAPHEDFDKYPRTFDIDRQLCEKAGVDMIFHPTAEVMYPGGQADTTRVVPPPVLEQSLYGQYRPHFFSGVATVVTRLLNLVQANVAYFGEKDYQQLVVVKKLVCDLQMPIKIIGVETVREEDGLASSSRNLFLSAEQRRQAPLLYQTLQKIAQGTNDNPDALSGLLNEGRERINALPNVDLKYLVACDVDTLAELKQAKRPMVLLVAAQFQGVWLIDTLVVR